ncbi:restriction endonuclease [Bacillus gobiensis]|nr:restriction endonuclease [Bacillus gobiensis]
MNKMNLEQFTLLQTLLEQCENSGDEFDNIIWKPVNVDSATIQEFDQHVKVVEESKDWPTNLNWKKGRVLEDLAVFLFERFSGVVEVKKNKRGDNETDIETKLSDKALPTFIKECIGLKIICECKNYKSKSIDVGMVTKLAEIIPDRGSRFGIFISINGMGGYGWRYGEGKRKKIMYSEKIPIISFTLNELKPLREGKNLYTFIQEKYNLLVDDVDDESAELPNESQVEYSKRLHEIIEHFYKCELIDHTQFKIIKENAIKRYGSLHND